MGLSILTLQFGPMENNAYLVADEASGEAAVIDPSFDSERVKEEADRKGVNIRHIWLTHAHFDHIAAVGALAEALNPLPEIGLHPADLALYRSGGGGKIFQIELPPLPEPTLAFSDRQILRLGESSLEILLTPGHTPGHVVFYAAGAGAALCGDLIFYHSVGRTDLPGGDTAQLVRSIHERILTLPPQTRLLPGHGPETTVEEEQASNPFLFNQ